MARILKLGEMLVQDNRITQAQLEKALERQRRSGGTLGTNLTELGLITEIELLEYLSKQLGVRSVDLTETSLDPDVVSLVPPDIVVKFRVIPLEKSARRLSVAMADPTNFFLLDALKRNEWNVTRAAKTLDINRVTLHKMIKRYNMQRTQAN